MAGALSNLAGLLAGLIVLPWIWARYLRRDVDNFRNKAPGALIRLSRGVTHARWHGPEGGPVLVCVHGLATPSYVWGPLIPYLTEQGYSVLVYDLYGRGYSDRVRGRQTREFFLSQLRDLLAAEGVEGRLSLMGYSMGGSIAAAYAAENPDRIDRLILLAPAGLILQRDRWARFVIGTPIIGDWLNEVIGPARFRRQNATPPEDPDAREIQGRVLREIRWRGSMAAMLSSLRNILSEDLRADHAAIAEAGIPVLAIWGGKDPVIPLRAMARLAEVNRKALHVELPDADHGLPYTYPASVSEAVEEVY